MGRPFMSDQQRVDAFWSRVFKTSSCWLYRGTLNGDGYGYVWDGCRRVRAHRFSWELAHGPTELHVLHKCDTPACVRPSHLFTGTQVDNLTDMRRKGRSWTPPVGERHPGSKLSDLDVLKIRKLYSTGGYWQSELAEKFGVSGPTISAAVTGRKRLTMHNPK